MRVITASTYGGPEVLRVEERPASQRQADDVLVEVTAAGVNHTFGTRMAAAGVALRTLQEWMGYRDFKTTLIYADYQPGEHEAELVEQAFGQGSKRGSKLSESAPTAGDLKPLEQAESDLM